MIFLLHFFFCRFFLLLLFFPSSVVLGSGTNGLWSSSSASKAQKQVINRPCRVRDGFSNLAAELGREGREEKVGEGVEGLALLLSLSSFFFSKFGERFFLNDLLGKEIIIARFVVKRSFSLSSSLLRHAPNKAPATSLSVLLLSLSTHSLFPRPPPARVAVNRPTVDVGDLLPPAVPVGGVRTFGAQGRRRVLAPGDEHAVGLRWAGFLGARRHRCVVRERRI